jgi:hypothetical protein
VVGGVLADLAGEAGVSGGNRFLLDSLPRFLFPPPAPTKRLGVTLVLLFLQYP